MTAEPCHDWRVFGHADPRCPATQTPPARLRAAPSLEYELLQRRLAPALSDLHGAQLRLEPVMPRAWARLLLLARSGRG